MDDKELIKLSMARFKIIEEIERSEAMAETLDKRWKKLNAIYQMARELGIALKEDEDVAIVRERWVRLKRDYATN